MVEQMVNMLISLMLARRADGKPDPYQAAGIAYGWKGNLSAAEMADLGAMLDTMGAFDDD